MALLRLATLVDKTQYRGWTRIGFHILLIGGIFLLIFSAYVPWFLYPAAPVEVPLKTYVGPVLRDALSVILQYYLLVFVFTTYAHKPLKLVVGLVLYYWLLFTFYYYSSFVVKAYFGLPDDYSGSITHFERFTYWDALRHPATFFHLLFIIERAFYPLAIKLLLEVYRRQVGNARLRRQYTQLELNFLKSQINPHFLFNVLNSVYSLTEEASPRAARIVHQLSSMMRYTLYETSEPLVPLIQELNFIRDYVALEQLRTTKRLSLTVSFPEAVDKSLQITPFILIPMVENAFKHGIQRTAKQSWVNLSVRIEATRLHFSVSNSKPASLEPGPGGLGLTNVRRRLTLLYPDHHLRIIDELNQYCVMLDLDLSEREKVNSHLLPAVSN